MSKVKLSAKAKTAKEAGAPIEAFCEVIRGGHALGADGKPMKKLVAVIGLWCHALHGEDQREELFKAAGILAGVHTLLEKGNMEDRHAAMGCLVALAASEKHFMDVVTHRVISTATAQLLGEHLRSKLPASQMLALAAARSEFGARVSDAALPALVGVLKSGAPGWAQTRGTQLYAAQALKSLVQNVEGDAPDVRQLRRLHAVQLGVVPGLVSLVAYAPRLPDPPVVPACINVLFPGVGGKRSGKKKSASKGAGEVPLGQKDIIATVAAACLRCLALVPEFVDHLMGCGGLPALAHCLLSANEEQAAHLTGVLWELAAEPEVSHAVVACHSVTLLLHVIARSISSVPSRRRARAKAGVKPQAKGARPPRGEQGEALRPINFHDVAVCNATGALHHLTFDDAAKAQVGAVPGGCAILAECLKAGNPQTYENAVGALWNVGLDAANAEALLHAQAPSFVTHPVPAAWMTQRVVISGEGFDRPAATDGSFLTQQYNEKLFP
ncbi:MAG: hypothetical protein WDW38_006743 [Sanguina aurantia]